MYDAATREGMPTYFSDTHWFEIRILLVRSESEYALESRPETYDYIVERKVPPRATTSQNIGPIHIAPVAAAFTRRDGEGIKGSDQHALRPDIFRD